MEEMIRQILERLNSMDKRLSKMVDRIDLIETETAELTERYKLLNINALYVRDRADDLSYEIYLANQKQRQ